MSVIICTMQAIRRNSESYTLKHGDIAVITTLFVVTIATLAVVLHYSNIPLNQKWFYGVAISSVAVVIAAITLSLRASPAIDEEGRAQPAGVPVATFASVRAGQVALRADIDAARARQEAISASMDEIGADQANVQARIDALRADMDEIRAGQANVRADIDHRMADIDHLRAVAAEEGAYQQALHGKRPKR